MFKHHIVECLPPKIFPSHFANLISGISFLASHLDTSMDALRWTHFDGRSSIATPAAAWPFPLLAKHTPHSSSLQKPHPKDLQLCRIVGLLRFIPDYGPLQHNTRARRKRCKSVHVVRACCSVASIIMILIHKSTLLLVLEKNRATFTQCAEPTVVTPTLDQFLPPWRIRLCRNVTTVVQAHPGQDP